MTEEKVDEIVTDMNAATAALTKFREKWHDILSDSMLGSMTLNQKTRVKAAFAALGEELEHE